MVSPYRGRVNLNNGLYFKELNVSQAYILLLCLVDFKKRRPMLSAGIKRGFPKDRIASLKEPRIKRDEGGYYILTLNENIKVYFEDYYLF